MKKTYIKPCTRVQHVAVESMIALSAKRVDGLDDVTFRNEDFVGGVADARSRGKDEDFGGLW